MKFIVDKNKFEYQEFDPTHPYQPAAICCNLITADEYENKIGVTLMTYYGDDEPFSEVNANRWVKARLLLIIF